MCVYFGRFVAETSERVLFGACVYNVNVCVCVCVVGMWQITMLGDAVGTFTTASGLGE